MVLFYRFYLQLMFVLVTPMCLAYTFTYPQVFWSVLWLLTVTCLLKNRQNLSIIYCLFWLLFGKYWISGMLSVIWLTLCCGWLILTMSKFICVNLTWKQPGPCTRGHQEKSTQLTLLSPMHKCCLYKQHQNSTSCEVHCPCLSNEVILLAKIVATFFGKHIPSTTKGFHIHLYIINNKVSGSLPPTPPHP